MKFGVLIVIIIVVVVLILFCMIIFTIHSNYVSPQCIERVTTIATVSRSICSGSAGISRVHPRRNNNNANNNTTNYGAGGDNTNTTSVQQQGGAVVISLSGNKNSRLLKLARPLYFSCMGTALFAAFMQWTGELGKLPESSVADAILTTFYSHLDRMKDMLNPNMSGEVHIVVIIVVVALYVLSILVCTYIFGVPLQGDKMRYLQISKARGVAVALLAASTRETLEAGRLGGTHQMAIERTAFALKVEGTVASVPWVIADTMEHMLGLDFLLLMQTLCLMLRVPVVKLDNLLKWLETGNSDHCPAITGFYARYVHHEASADVDACSQQVDVDHHDTPAATFTWANRLVPDGVFEAPGGDGGNGLISVGSCLYITADNLLVRKQSSTILSADARVFFCDQVPY